MIKRGLCFGLAAVLSVAGLTTVASAQGKKASVKIVNKTDYDIHHMFLAAHESDEWGPDQLGKNVIAKKTGSFTLTDIPCETYDIQLVDQDGDKCEVANIDICGGSATWQIDNDDLLACQGWGSAE
jgi:hypothetical protein